MYISTERNAPRIPWSYAAYLAVMLVLLTMTVQLFGQVTDVSSRMLAGGAEMQTILSSFEDGHYVP